MYGVDDDRVLVSNHVLPFALRVCKVVKRGKLKRISCTQKDSKRAMNGKIMGTMD